MNVTSAAIARHLNDSHLIIEEEEDENEAEHLLLAAEAKAIREERERMEEREREKQAIVDAQNKVVNEWDAVTKENTVIKSNQLEGEINADKGVEKGTNITYSEAWQMFTSLDKCEFATLITPEDIIKSVCPLNHYSI